MSVSTDVRVTMDLLVLLDMFRAISYFDWFNWVAGRLGSVYRLGSVPRVELPQTSHLHTGDYYEKYSASGSDAHGGIVVFPFLFYDICRRN